MNQQHIDSMVRIDSVAAQGYRYAVGLSYDVEFRSDMDLLAFNAGINNANHHNGTNVETLKAITSRRLEGRPQTPDKELSIRV